jgi:hypothetical protein
MNFDSIASDSTQTSDFQAAQYLAANQWTSLLMLASIGFAPMLTAGTQITFETIDGTQGALITTRTATLDQVTQELARIHQELLTKAVEPDVDAQRVLGEQRPFLYL